MLWSVSQPAVVLTEVDIHDVDRIFRLHPDLRCVVVDNGRDPLGLIDRGRVELRLNGRLGYGRALHAFRAPSTPIEVPALVVDTHANPHDVSRAIADRPKAHRLDDIVVRSGPTLATVAVAEIFASLAVHYEHLASTDPLTDVANRRRLMTALEERVEDPHGGEVALVLFDVDRFKRINDRHGHPAGDAVLVETARRLREWSPTGSVPGRIGGDEFAVVLPPLDRESIEATVRRLHEALRRRVTYDHEPIFVDTSGGWATTHTIASLDVTVLQRHADRALYKAKAAGGARIVADLPLAAPHASTETDSSVDPLLSYRDLPSVQGPSTGVSQDGNAVFNCHTYVGERGGHNRMSPQPPS
ncbi:MAG TPA: GGDEF domain-containing protein [Acidimicrobiales bacterium]|nr:GGDEF domain-containing protein [Acidimicrobiales bacterium]